LLVNTGTPKAARAAEVRQFLRPFLSDPRVVELPRWLWVPLLNGLILPLRAPKSARNYQRIWRTDGSPLAVYSAALAEAVARALQGVAPDSFSVKVAYLYSKPGVAESIQQCIAGGMRRLIMLPMYPQYSGTTTAAVFDQVSRELQTLRAIPELHFIRDFHLDSAYVAALAASVREHWNRNQRGGHLLMSFHGIPERCVLRGDPYGDQCKATAAALAAALDLKADDWSLSFQSRFGKARWLEPATDATLVNLARASHPSLDVICPGFSVDCLETLEEIAIGGREIYQHAGGGEFRYIGALNARADHAAALAGLVHQCLRVG
jgi:ferrochelatase